MDVYLNGATIMSTPTPRQLEIARAAGFAGIEARAERLLEDAGEVEATADAVRPGEVWSLNGVRISLLADGSLDRASLETDLTPRLEICRRIGAAALLAVPPRLRGVAEADALHGIREGLQLARDRAAEHGIRVAFEFLGFPDCPIRTPGGAGRAVDQLDGVDVVLDSCHWHAAGSGPLDAFPVDRLAMVHLNDVPPMPPERIEDADRLLPGQGVIHLPELVAALVRRGYAGRWSVETFNPAYWNADPLAVAREAAAAAHRLVDG